MVSGRGWGALGNAGSANIERYLRTDMPCAEPFFKETNITYLCGKFRWPVPKSAD